MRPFDTLCPWLAEPLQQLEQAAVAERLGHGWLISGRQGIGKANLAYVLADRLLNGREGSKLPDLGSPQDITLAYRSLTDDAELHPDLHRIAPPEGKRTIVVDQIRDLTMQLTLTPHQSRRKLVIIERAEAMTRGAANALLKSLEEPTRATFLLLLTDRPGSLPATIRSRCQRLALKSPPPTTVHRWLESIPGTAVIEPDAVAIDTPVKLAALILDEDKISKYNKIHSHIKLLFEGRIDPFTLADGWIKEDTELALTCLITQLQRRIRNCLIPGHSNQVTDAGHELTDNQAQESPTDALFRGLRVAEQLREQLGRGSNVEIAMRSLLLGLESHHCQRVTT